MKKNIKFIWAICMHCNRAAVVIKIILYFLSSILTAGNIVVLQKLIDSIVFGIEHHVVQKGIFWGILFVVIELAASNMQHFNRLANLSLMRSMNQFLPKIMIDKYQKIAFPDFEGEENQNIFKRVNEKPVEKILAILDLAGEMLSDIVSAAALCIVFAVVDIFIPLFFIVVLIIVIKLNFLGSKLMSELFFEQTNDERKMDYFRDLFMDRHSLAELSFFGAVSYIRKKWKMYADIVLKERLSLTVKSQKYFAASCSILTVWVAFVAFILIMKLSNGGITIGAFISMTNSSISVLAIGDRIAQNFLELARKSQEIIYLSLFFGIQNEERTDNISGENITIKFEDVSFRYPGTDREILKNINFAIHNGEKIAIVGENGAGKSTLIKLLCGLYEPTKGKVTINGTEVCKIRWEELSKVIGVVWQNFQSYWVSLRENVALCNLKEKGDDSKIWKALENVHFSGIESLDISLGKLDDNSVDLSKGQWQRLAIARSCFAEKNIIVFDEPTASLDPIAESRLYATIYDLLKERSCILISHRLASAKMADRILVFREGKLVEEGSHDVLLKKGGYYSEMWSAQSSWYK